MSTSRSLQAGGGMGGGGFSGGYSAPVVYHPGLYASSDDQSDGARMAIFLAILLLRIAFFLYSNHVAKQNAARESMDNAILRMKEYVNNEDAENAEERVLGFLSGSWRGYYHQEGTEHSLFEFQLQAKQLGTNHDDGEQVAIFSSDIIQLEGSGVDSVGEYKIFFGVFNPRNYRVFVVKSYIHGTGNMDQNLGHEVAYVGCVQGRGERGLSAGIRGTWFTATSQYVGQGQFHIWPAAQSRKTTIRSDSTSTSVLPGFQVSPDNECVVCFDETINTALRPCGHIALCGGCADRLNACPICRDPVECIEELQIATAVEDTSDDSDTMPSDNEEIV